MGSDLESDEQIIYLPVNPFWLEAQPRFRDVQFENWANIQTLQ